MPIRILTVDHKSFPAVFCDHCNQRIELAKDGNVEWRDVDVAEMHFTHKRCSDAFRRAQSTIRLSMELKLFPLRLAYGLEVDLESAHESLERLAELA